MESNVVAFKTTPPKIGKTYGELYEEAVAGMKADPFFGPIITAYGDDLGRGYIVTELGLSDLYEDGHNLLFKMKLTALDVHISNLGEADCYDPGSEDYDETWEAANKLDADVYAFVERFGSHFAGDYPVLREMLATSFTPERSATFDWALHSWELMKWVLWWAEKKGREANQSAA